MVTVPETPQDTVTESVLRDHPTVDPLSLGVWVVDRGRDGGAGGVAGSSGAGGVIDVGGGASASAGGGPSKSSCGTNGKPIGGSDDAWADAMLTDATHISAVAIRAPRETRVKRFVKPRLMSHPSHPGAVIGEIEFPATQDAIDEFLATMDAIYDRGHFSDPRSRGAAE